MDLIPLMKPQLLPVNKLCFHRLELYNVSVMLLDMIRATDKHELLNQTVEWCVLDKDYKLNLA